jgi:metal-responsive CopG/Arc/MetJ family transcriptional regulator
MKTAISIPDQIYDRAEKLARRLGKSRSELYAKAVQNYVDRHQDDDVTAKLNTVYSSESSELDPVLTDLQTKSWLKHNPW